jgi:hypothetical protein
MDLERIGVMPDVIENLKAGKRAEIFYDKRLKMGDLVIVSELFTIGPGYEAKVVSISSRTETLGGERQWFYGVEPTGRIKERVAYIHAESCPCKGGARTN